MFGDRLLRKTMVYLTDEGNNQYVVTRDEVAKLAKVTGEQWGLIHAKLFDKVRVRCFIEGAATFAVGTIIGKAYLAFKESKKQDTTESEESK